MILLPKGLYNKFGKLCDQTVKHQCIQCFQSSKSCDSVYGLNSNAFCFVDILSDIQIFVWNHFIAFYFKYNWSLCNLKLIVAWSRQFWFSRNIENLIQKYPEVK